MDMSCASDASLYLLLGQRVTSKEGGMVTILLLVMLALLLLAMIFGG